MANGDSSYRCINVMMNAQFVALELEIRLFPWLWCEQKQWKHQRVAFADTLCSYRGNRKSNKILCMYSSIQSVNVRKPCSNHSHQTALIIGSLRILTRYWPSIRVAWIGIALCALPTTLNGSFKRVLPHRCAYEQTMRFVIRLIMISFLCCVVFLCACTI